QQINVPQWDGKQIDVDGDGDREHLSGRNNIGNPSVDLRSFATPGGGADHTQGIYPHTYTADKIAGLAHSVDGVQNARAIITGTTAIIGLNLDRGLNAGRQAAVTQFVRQRVLVQAPEFRRVHITSDKAQTRRIQRIADEMRAGHSLSMFSDDIAELTRTIPAVGPSSMPAVPGANAQESRTSR
ncbi:MAG: YhcN/YlaJ family sporulation lipoprotein, partial [Tumebacillaceae bacterium]